MADRYGLDLVVVEWEDSTSVAGWHDTGDLVRLAGDRSWIVHNVGWVVHADDDCVIVAGRVAVAAEQCGLVERIPRRAILSITKMEQER